MSTSRIRVEGDAPYDVLVGTGLLGGLDEAIGPDAARVAVVHPAGLDEPAGRLRADLAAAGRQVLDLPVPAAEAAKTAEVAAGCWAALGRAGFTRSDAVVGVGGGATTDLAGFVAATWLRGVRLVHVPTTLLGMVDAAVGGKTGINTAEGKNLVGAFHPPAAVLCDLEVLTTLPAADLASGMAEVVKVGLTSDPVILDLVEAGPTGADPLRELVERAVRVKAEVVAADLRESRPGGLGREVLNYGHTFGHAVEHVEHYTWRHGEAVSVGLVYVAELAQLAGLLPESDVARHRTLLTAVGLPVSYRGDRWSALRAAMMVDKKSRGDRLRFVALTAVGSPTLLEAPDPSLLQAAYARISA
ncbi:MAG TPA: 3-dehydroquinate synthase [Candidatus Nanopelagicales bacterium]|nr:3-dehydroquinate synthase [Candidatus Nanopelagicales bacterium]